VRDFALPGEVDPRYLPGWSSDWWSTNHPLGIERMSYITLVTADEEKARRVFIDVLGGTHLMEGRSPLTKTRDLYISLGTQTVLQLSIPERETSLAGIELATHGESLHSLAFTVRDLPAVAQFLATKGVAIASRDDQTILVDPADSFGAPYRFTTFRAPGDPRDEGLR
jgi:catechol 2,3-dioxygenase-like lactoylglutathione lyase family enzyme